MQPITVLGLGAMGSALASALAGAGYSTTVWNRSPEKADTEHALTDDALRHACTTAIEHLAVADRIYPGRDPRPTRVTCPER